MLVAILEGHMSEIENLKKELTKALNYVADMRLERDAALEEVERLKAKTNGVGNSSSHSVAYIRAGSGDA
jgi:hypothetical protein